YRRRLGWLPYGKAWRRGALTPARGGGVRARRREERAPPPTGGRAALPDVRRLIGPAWGGCPTAARVGAAPGLPPPAWAPGRGQGTTPGRTPAPADRRGGRRVGRFAVRQPPYRPRLGWFPYGKVWRRGALTAGAPWVAGSGHDTERTPAPADRRGGRRVGRF